MSYLTFCVSLAYFIYLPGHPLFAINPIYSLLTLFDYEFFSFRYLEDLYFFHFEVGLTVWKIVLSFVLVLDILWLLVVCTELPKLTYIFPLLVKVDAECIIEAHW